MNVKSFAKINLSLSLKGVREDGYHLLEMVNLPLLLHDSIEINKTPHLGDTFVTCDEPHLNALHRNLCAKAIEMMKEVFGFEDDFLVHIHKEIPFAAGLGGGSSNAAAVMLAVCKIMKIDPNDPRIGEIAMKLGADVPYFLSCAPALIKGIGEIDRVIKVKKAYDVVLLKPEEGCSTADIYSISDNFERLDIDTAKVVEALEKGDDEGIKLHAGNDLYAPALSRVPLIKDYIRILENDGFFYAAMSGSGSAVFGLTTDQKLAKEAYKRYVKKGYNAYLTRTFQ